MNTYYQLSSLTLFLISSLSLIHMIRNKNINNKKDDNDNNDDNNNNDNNVSYMKLIGNTPMIELKTFSNKLGCRFYVKMESMNPSGTGIK